MARKQVRRDFIIIGLDSFGENLALALLDLGNEVLAVDRDPAVVQRLADNIQDIVALDATDDETLRALGIEAFETAVVAIGGDLAQAVLVTLALKELGVKRVVCEAQSDRDRRVLLRIGADEVVAPTIESARAIAYHLTGRAGQSAHLRFGNYLAVKWRPPRSFSGTIGELQASHADVEIVLLSGRELIINPGPAYAVTSGDELLVVGHEESIAALQASGRTDG
ncbi:putative Ktr system potassium uptake protein C [Candidatus Promineifilum breve]|uniref:Ktr system potassium uptake protein C n=1 Tax=Candidatus Promineifilum breve TaxID=1806508 RepID=A0A170PEB8_9CHLR|nr:TrkA family potassium uptake protein [Candidatus Promineifilum breve]CUS02477.1 putative Ktr system potassium uptake protein C [Candidatus Promineifilum breve]